jgi:hypothetical protein
MNEKDMSRLEMDAAAMAILIGIAKGLMHKYLFRGHANEMEKED